MWCAYRSSFYCHSVYFIWAPLITQLIKNPPAMQETRFSFWVGKIPWRRDKLPTPVFLDFPGGSDGKESACNERDLGSIPGLRRFPGGGHGNPLQYSCLKNPHRQRSLEVYSPWGSRVRHDQVTKHSTAQHSMDKCLYKLALGAEHKGENTI